MKRIDLVPGAYFKRWSRLYHVESVSSDGIMVEDCFTEVKTQLDIVVLLEDDVHRIYPVAVFEPKTRQIAGIDKITEMVKV